MYVYEIYYEIFVIVFYSFFIMRVNLLFNIIPCQNNDEKFLKYLFKISYVVRYHPAEF